jgi:hypothetical protein
MKNILFVFALFISLLFTASLFPQQQTFNATGGDGEESYMKEIVFTFKADSAGGTYANVTSSRFQLNDIIRNSSTITNPFTAWYTTTVAGTGGYGDTTAYKAILKGYANGVWQALDTITVANTSTTVSGVQKIDMNNWRATDYLWYITQDASACKITSGSITIVAVKPED